MKNDKKVAIKTQIWIWDNQDEGMFYYKIDKNDKSKKKHFNFELDGINYFFIKTENNNIKWIKDHKEFNSNDEIQFRVRKSFKKNIYEIINPININKSEYSNFYLNDKIWYPVKSSTYPEGNNQNYILNEKDIIKLGRKKYIVNKMYFKEEKGKIKDDNFNKNNNISYISYINKNSKSIFNIDIKINQYIINNNKYYEKVNEDENDNISKNETSPESGNKKKSISGKEIKNGAMNKIRNLNETMNESGNKNESINESGNKSSINKSENKNSINKSENKNSINESGNKNETINENKNKYGKCWSCSGLFSSKNNPLICLCDCRDYIHYECLKVYLSSKLIITENLKKTVTTYRCEKFNCDICLKPYRLRFRIPEFDKTYELIDLTLPKETDYICLESLDYIKYNNNIKILHIVKLIDEEIAIGRQDYNDIIDNDISISREHAILRYNKNNGNLFLENTNGKFGTLVLVRGNIKITEEKNFFQSGKAYISTEVKA